MKARTLASLTLASVLAVGVARQATTGAREMQASDEAMSTGDTARAIDGARAAAEALLPGSPYPRRGMERLAQIGRDAEARGDLATAGMAFRAMRSAVAETRALGGGHAAWRGEAIAGLARVASKEDASGTGTPQTPPSEASDAREPGPSPLELLLAGALPFALYAAAARFLRRPR